eukprot:2408345-Pyramimonas_sp.AAC.1
MQAEGHLATAQARGFAAQQKSFTAWAKKGVDWQGWPSTSACEGAAGAEVRAAHGQAGGSGRPRHTH